MISDIDHHKRSLRQTVQQNRKKPTPRQARLIRDEIARFIWREKPASVALVWPLEREIDLRPLFLSLHKSGVRIFLPFTTKKGQPLIFRQWFPAVKMREGRFGTSYPKGGVGHPDMIFVPLLAYDREGRRLGYGGGYYDRTLAVHSHAVAIGYGLSCQEEGTIPTDSFDKKLEAIITENEFITFHPQ